MAKLELNEEEPEKAWKAWELWQRSDKFIKCNSYQWGGHPSWAKRGYKVRLGMGRALGLRLSGARPIVSTQRTFIVKSEGVCIFSVLWVLRQSCVIPVGFMCFQFCLVSRFSLYSHFRQTCMVALLFLVFCWLPTSKVLHDDCLTVTKSLYLHSEGHAMRLHSSLLEISMTICDSFEICDPCERHPW